LIEWDSLIVEMLILAAIIWFAEYLEHWTYKRSEKKGTEGKKIFGNFH